MDVEISHDKEHESQPHEALYLVLSYLPLFELLSMSEVCRSFKDALDNDILPWMNIVVDEKLQKSRVSDDILMRITRKSKGRLRSLVLINCVKITDDGLQAVIAMNPNVNKLHVTQCTGLTPDGIVKAVTTLNQHDATLKTLKINGIHNITKDHLETLRVLLNADKEPHKHLYPEHKHSTSTRERSIDVGICPKCDEVRVVFDCPLETCVRKRTLRGCRGCKFCILRCEECGKCIDFDEEEDGEAACEDMLCEECWIQLPKCDFCNKPYCNQHAYKQCVLPGSSGFICDVCYSKI